jgi:transcriptional regulator with XRE-family HTH domain
MKRLPEAMRRQLVEARHKRGWTQTQLGKQLGLPQMHVSGIETGKIVPRFDTLLDIARVLDQDLLMVPRELVPAVWAMVRDHRRRNEEGSADEQPLYAMDEETSHEA